MSALSIQPTFPIFTDIDGQPLDSGYVFIGTANLNPIGNPINVFFDAALTQPAVQPIRTISGYPSNAGTPARLYVNSDYSIQVQNKNGTLVYSAPTATERYNDVVISLNAENVIYDPPFANAVSTNVEAKLSETASVKDFGAVGDGVTDDSDAFIAAIASAQTVYVPVGEYYLSKPIIGNESGPELIGLADSNNLLDRFSNYSQARLICETSFVRSTLSYAGTTSFTLKNLQIISKPYHLNVGSYSAFKAIEILGGEFSYNLLDNVSISGFQYSIYAECFGYFNDFRFCNLMGQTTCVHFAPFNINYTANPAFLPVSGLWNRINFESCQFLYECQTGIFFAPSTTGYGIEFLNCFFEGPRALFDFDSPNLNVNIIGGASDANGACRFSGSRVNLNNFFFANAFIPAGANTALIASPSRLKMQNCTVDLSPGALANRVFRERPLLSQNNTLLNGATMYRETDANTTLYAIDGQSSDFWAVNTKTIVRNSFSFSNSPVKIFDVQFDPTNRRAASIRVDMNSPDDFRFFVIEELVISVDSSSVPSIQASVYRSDDNTLAGSTLTFSVTAVSANVFAINVVSSSATVVDWRAALTFSSINAVGGFNLVS